VRPEIRTAIAVYNVLRRLDWGVFADVSAFRVKVKQLKNTGFLDPESKGTTAL